MKRSAPLFARASWLAWAGSLACAIGGACRSEGELPGASGQRTESSAAVSVVKVGRGKVERTIVTHGTVEFAADRQRTLSFVKPGQVVNVVVVAGQTVKKGDALLWVGGVPRGSLEVQQASIEVEFAERELARTRRLTSEKLATNQDREAAEKRVAAAKAALQSLGGSASAAMRSSTDGVVAKVLVQRGDRVQAGQMAVVLAEHDAWTVRAGFEVEDLPQLEPGLAVRLKPVYGDERAKGALASLSTLHRVVDPTTQLVEGLIHLEAPPDWIAAGLAVRVQVVVEARTGVVRIPRDALVRRGNEQGVYVVEAGHAHFRALELGIGDARLVEVKRGLESGVHVVTTGRSSLDDGMAVRPADAGAP